MSTHQRRHRRGATALLSFTACAAMLLGGCQPAGEQTESPAARPDAQATVTRPAEGEVSEQPPPAPAEANPPAPAPTERTQRDPMQKP